MLRILCNHCENSSETAPVRISVRGRSFSGHLCRDCEDALWYVLEALKLYPRCQVTQAIKNGSEKSDEPLVAPVAGTA
jgi:hypothetical protein